MRELDFWLYVSLETLEGIAKVLGDCEFIELCGFGLILGWVIHVMSGWRREAWEAWCSFRWWWTSRDYRREHAFRMALAQRVVKRWEEGLDSGGRVLLSGTREEILAYKSWVRNLGGVPQGPAGSDGQRFEGSPIQVVR